MYNVMCLLIVAAKIRAESQGKIPPKDKAGTTQ